MAQTNPMQRLSEFLTAYAAATDPEERQRIEAELWQTFGQKAAVFVSDLSGFSRMTASHSIVHFLSLIYESRRMLEPVITDHGGKLIKTTADNIYALFPSAQQAIESAVAMQQTLQRANTSREPDFRISMCVGIGYGDVLVMGEEDFFGHQLNLAFKLGEDVADPGEILVTAAALDAAGNKRFAHEARTIELSGVKIEHGSVRYEKG